jgi:hypothetical protein
MTRAAQVIGDGARVAGVVQSAARRNILGAAAQVAGFLGDSGAGQFMRGTLQRAPRLATSVGPIAGDDTEESRAGGMAYEARLLGRLRDID